MWMALGNGVVMLAIMVSSLPFQSILENVSTLKYFPTFAKAERFGRQRDMFPMLAQNGGKVIPPGSIVCLM